MKFLKAIPKIWLSFVQTPLVMPMIIDLLIVLPKIEMINGIHFIFDCTQLNANTFTLLFRMGPFYEWSTWFFLQLNGCCVSCYLTLEISFAVFCWKEAHIMMASCPFYFTTDCTQQPKYNLYYPFLVIWLCVVCGFFLRLRAFRFIFISSILIHSIVYYSNGHFIHLEFSLHILIEVQSNISHLWLGS